jgi:hypothetical protein
MEEKKIFKGVLINEYRSKNGNPTFLYKITNATDAELASFKAFKGDTYTKEPYIEEVNGEVVEMPLVWESQWHGNNAEFTQSSQGNIRVDNSAMLRAEGFAKRNGWLAKEVASSVVAQMDFGFSKSITKRTELAVQIAQESGPLDRM